MAGHYDINISQGATFTFDVQVNHTNLATGYTARMKGRSHHANASAIFDWTTANGKIALTHQGSHSHITITVSAADTAALTAPMSGVYDIEYEQTSGTVVTRILEGSFYITPEVTRA
jgi:hypothetical protein